VRVLFSSMGLVGHINPMVPLARALAARGHEIRWATTPDGCARVEQAGFDAVPAGITQAERWAELDRRYPEIGELPAQQRPDAMFPKLFGAISVPPALADLLPFVRAWRPALVVNDAAELASPIAAAAIGVPHATHSFGALLPEHRVRAGGEEVAALWQAQGLQARPYGGLYDHVYLDIYPPSMQPAGDDHHLGARRYLRPVPFAGATDDRLDDRILERTGKPLVYLTFGTVFNDYPAFPLAVAGIHDAGVGAVVTVGPNSDPAILGAQPSRVVVERYVPQTLLLPECDVVASHAGSGTALAALSMGIPQLCLPQAADQFLNAAAIAHAGAGISIAPQDVDRAGVALAIRRLLDEDRYRAAARRVAREIAAMPSPDEVAAELEALV
jgi:UDP:flavonoid glycosyltransferase YjiC (YdhE family)